MRASCADHPRKFAKGCSACAERNREYHRYRRRALREGTWEPDWTGDDLARVRAHVQALLAIPGLPGTLLARVVGVSTHTVYSVAAGRRKSITAVSGRALLAATADLCAAGRSSSGDPMVDPVGLERRLQALLADGWDSAALSALSGNNRDEIGRWRCGFNRTVRLRTHLRFKALYEKIQGMPDPSGPSIDAIRQARRLGYLPPERWAEEDIDDPLAEPLPPEPETDDWVEVNQTIDRVLRGGHPGAAADLPRAIQREIAKRARLLDCPLDWVQIAALMGFKSASSAEYLVHGRPDRPAVRGERG